jgi:hypothetical protein
VANLGDDATHLRAGDLPGRLSDAGGGPAIAVKLTEGQDHPLLLTAVLADRGGAKALVAEGPGEYTVYDLTAGARVARHLVWLRLPPEAYAIDERIGPSCGGEAAGAPPAGPPPARPPR